MYVDQLQRILGTLPGPQGDVLQTIRAQLEDEPCVKEFPYCHPASDRRGFRTHRLRAYEGKYLGSKKGSVTCSRVLFAY